MTAQLQWNAHKSAVHLAMCLVPILQVLADALRVNRTITEVNLSMNNFGDEGLKARAPQSGAAAGPTCDFCSVSHVVVCVDFTCALRADPSTDSARPWPRPWKSTKPSQRLSSTCQGPGSQCSVMKDTRRSGLGGSSSKVVR